MRKEASPLAKVLGATLFALGAVGILTQSCQRKKDSSIFWSEAHVDLDSIMSRGTLRVVTDYNSVNYFVCKGQQVGYQYELLTAYAKQKGLTLEMKADNEFERCLDKLKRGEVDIISNSMMADSALMPDILFCEPYGSSNIVTVRRKGSASALTADDTICAMQNSVYTKILRQIADTCATRFHIREIANYDAEILVDLVAEEEIGQTVCFGNIARANQWKYDNLDATLRLTNDIDMAWGVRKSSPALQADISEWMRAFKKTAAFKRIYRKYVIDPREHHSNVQSVSANTYQNTYEADIKRIATNSRYDWHLISAVVYQESHFNPAATSWAGACGLMQLMPETAARFGVDDPKDPQQSLEAGYAYLLWLDARLASNIPNSRERVKFALGAYNIGLGHIMDAMRLAEKVGKDPQVWTGNVETALLLKANPAYTSDPVVKHGFCRGTETINYVRNIMDRTKNYKMAYK